jgi:hypothetical protein
VLNKRPTPIRIIDDITRYIPVLLWLSFVAKMPLTTPTIPNINGYKNNDITAEIHPRQKRIILLKLIFTCEILSPSISSKILSNFIH